MKPLQAVVVTLSVLSLGSCRCGEDGSGSLDLSGDGVQAGRVTITATQGGADPALRTLSLNNTGACSLDFVATVETTTGGAWLRLVSASGSIDPSQAFAFAVDVTLTPGGLPLAPGTYDGRVLVAATCRTTGVAASGSPGIFLFTLIVQARDSGTTGVGGGTGGGSVGGGTGGGGGGGGGSVGGGTGGGGGSAGGGTGGGSVGGGTGGGSVGGGTGGGSVGGGTGGGSVGGGTGGGSGGTGGGASSLDAGVGDCASPFRIASFPFTATRTLSGPSSADSTCRQGAATAPEHYYQFTTTQEGRFRATVKGLDGGLIPVLSVISLVGAGCSSGNPWGCARAQIPNEAIDLVIESLPADTYNLIVDGLESRAELDAGAGPYRLDVTFDNLAFDSTGSTCGSVGDIVLVNGGAEFTASTVDAGDDGVPATLFFGQPIGCGTFGNPDRNYRLVIPGTSAKTAVSIRMDSLNESQGGTRLAIGDTCATDAGVFAACRSFEIGPILPDDARFTGVYDGGAQVAVWVESTFTAGHPFRLKVATAPMGTLANEQCSGATPILLNASYAGTTLGAVDDYGFPGYRSPFGAPNQCLFQNVVGGADVFYRYTATVDGNVTFRVQPERGVDVTLVLLSSCDQTTCLANANPDGTTTVQGESNFITYSLTSGQTVYLAVDHADQELDTYDRGGFTLSVTP